MSSSSATTAPEPSLILFARGVIARLNTWPVLTVAVDNSWGGPDSADKRTWMASVVVDSFDPSQSQETPDDIYIEEQLLQMVMDEFDTSIEDGSGEEVAKDIVKLWTQLQDSPGGEAAKLVDEWESVAKRAKGKRVPAEFKDETQETEDNEDDLDDEEDEDGEDEAPALLPPNLEKKIREAPVVDEDGFTLVKKGGTSHR